MELSNQIKKHRTAMKLSQEDLAEKVYVSRQTISNWETEKSYPDIHSLLLLSSLFDISLDQLIKGDIYIMKEEIRESEISKFNHYGSIFGVLFIVFLVSCIPLVWFLKVYGILISIAIYTVTLYFGFKLEKVKKENNISTYKEIVAFTEGKKLDEIQKQQELAKRPYQNVLRGLFGAVMGAIIAAIAIFILETFK